MDENIQPVIDPGEQKPFVVHLHQMDVKHGSYRPATSLHISPTLRTSGMLKQLAAEDLKNLMFILTFLSPNGICQPSIHELSQAMGVSAFKVRHRMKKLAACLWEGESLVQEIKRPSGLTAFAPAHGLVGTLEWRPRCPHCDKAKIVEPQPPECAAEPAPAVDAPTQSVTTKEAESAITVSSPPVRPLPVVNPREVQAELRSRLASIGVSENQAEYLISEFPPDRIARQIIWLQFRKARNPAALIVRAIEADYQAPLGPLEGL